MGTCYSISRLETTIQTKRPYNKSFIRNEQSNSQAPTLTSCHQLITPSYLATISNNQLITINNQTNELKPKNSCLDANQSSSYISRQTNPSTKMYEMKNASTNSNGANKIISKLPKFNLGGRQQVHDVSSQLNATKISHFGAKKTTALNADLLRLKGGLGTNGKQQQSKSSNSSLTNSETSCGSSLSTNSTASYSNVNKKNNDRKLTFIKSSAASSSVSLNERPKINKQTTTSSSRVVISKQPIASNDQPDISKSAPCSVAVQFNQALTKLPTASRFTTTTIPSIPKPQPQIAQRVNTSSNQRPTALSNQLNSFRSIPSCNLYQTGNLNANQKCLRPYTLKNTSLSNDNYQPYKKPYMRASHSGPDAKSGSSLRYPYSESNLKSKLTFGYQNSNHIETNQACCKSQQLNNNKKVNSYSGLPVPNGNFRSSKPELSDALNCNQPNSSKTNSSNSLNNHDSHSSINQHHRSNDLLHQPNLPPYHFNQQNHQSQLNEATIRSLTSENENLAPETKRLSTSFESATLSKDLNEQISRAKVQSKLSNQPNFNNSLNQPQDLNAHNTIFILQNLVNKKQQQLIGIKSKQALNSIEITENSILGNEQSITRTSSQKSNSPSSSLTPDISSTSKISPEHNRSDFLIDDEICDQPDLMFLKENSTNLSPVKESMSLVDGLNSNTNKSSQYKTNIRYSISELDSLKLKQELLNRQNNYEKAINDPNSQSSPEKALSSGQSPLKQFRKPRPLSVVESVDGNLALDASSFRSVMQDINGIKTLLFRLQGELQESGTQNPFENILNSSHCKNQNLMSNGLDDLIDKEDQHTFIKEEYKNQNLEFENQNLKKQLTLMRQQMEEKERTIRLLQQQMTKYLNINEVSADEKLPKTSTSIATTQTDRCPEFDKNFSPESKKTSDGFVVKSNDKTDLT